jgi:hypothetical protein
MDTRQVLLNYLTAPRRMFEGLVRMPFCSRFFEPKQKFLDWCKETYPGAHWIDCGAGQGHVTKLLRENGLVADALDLFLAEEDVVIDDMIQMDSAMYPFSNRNVALMCRPCRGDWIHATIIKAVNAHAPLVYVGKESHFEEDLKPLPYKIELVMQNAGEMNENVWLVTLNNDI